MNLLDRIKSTEFYDTLGYDLPAEIMSLVFRDTPELKQFQDQYKSGALTDDQLQTYVHDLLDTFVRGQKFPFDRTLAFLVLALERISTPFVKSFIESLARMRIAELHVSPRIAQLAVRERAKMAKAASRKFDLEKVHPDSRVFVARSTSPKPGQEANHVAP